MLFGGLGDALLIWPEYFDAGVFSFLVGHLIYINAFGFKPLKLSIGITCYALAILGEYYNPFIHLCEIKNAFQEYYTFYQILREFY